MIKGKDLKNKLISDLNNEFSKLGFQFEKTQEWFRKNHDDISHFYKLDFYTTSGGYRVQPVLCVRSEKLHLMYHKISGIKQADQKYHSAINTTVWRLYRNRSDGEFILTSEMELKSVGQSILNIFNKTALPFFDQCSSIADIDRMFNTNPDEQLSRQYNLNDFPRCCYATIAAKIVENPNYSDLVQAYRSFLKTYRKGKFLDQYEKLLLILDDVSMIEYV